jgi:general stress protein 26
MSQRVSPSVPKSTEDLLAENAICTLTTSRPDGSFHVAPVRFTLDRDAGLVWIMTVGQRRKARNITANPAARATVCQLVGHSWVTLEG